MNTKYILVEGGDGTGKTTLIKNLKKKLESEGKSVIVVSEPSTPQLDFTQKIREIALSEEYDIDPLTRDLLFQACRNLIHKKIVLPAKGNYDYIIQDRGLISSFAYLLANNSEYKHAQMLSNFIYNTRLSEIYDGIVLIDNPVDTSLKRIDIRASKKDIFDKKPKEFFSLVKRNMVLLSQSFKNVHICSNDLISEQEFTNNVHDYITKL